MSPSARPGPLNLITDVAGIHIGQAQDMCAYTGVTLVLCDGPCVGAVDVRGGAPGTRETDVLRSEMMGVGIHGVVLSGGSALGLDAASGIAAVMSARGIGLRFSPDMPPVPILPGAILFDLTNGGNKDWGDHPPYRDLGIEAFKNAQAAQAAQGDHNGRFALGTAGAGTGAKAGRLKGGLGSASVAMAEGIMVGAIAAVNSVGSVLVPGTATFWAAPYALTGELGEQGSIAAGAAGADFPDDGKVGAGPATNTTIAVIATDADLTRAEAERVAMMAQDGMARAMRPAHTPIDGDTVFVLATAKQAISGERLPAIARIGNAAADCLARAIARGVYMATSLGPAQSYRDHFGV
jgi:L-aminopeptidase/D-esterase-like protein